MFPDDNLTLTQLIDEGLLSRRSANALGSAGFTDLRSLRDAAMRGYAFGSVKGLGAKSAREVERLLQRSLFDSAIEATGSTPAPDNSPRGLYNRLSPLQTRVIDDAFERLRASLPVRALNFLDAHGIGLHRLLQLMGQPLKRYSALCPGRFMKKSLADIYALNEALHCELLLVASMDPRQVRLHCISRRFPFLFGPSRRFVSDFYGRHGRVPLLHIIEQYLCYSHHRDDRIFCLVRGIGTAPRTTVSLAAEFGLTSERIRQLADAGPRMLREEWFQAYDFMAFYAPAFAPGFVTDAPGSTLDRIRLDEQLIAGPTSILPLIACLSGWPLYQSGTHSLLLSPAIDSALGGVDPLEAVQQIIDTRRNVPQTVSLRDLITAALPGADPATVAPLVHHLAVDCLGCEPIGETDIRLPRTWVDVTEECVAILREHGQPMHIDALFDEFKHRFPEHKFYSSAQLRRMLWTDHRIRPVGKQSRYGLAEWSHIYYGSIRDLLCDCLAAADRPMSADELYECVRKHYPDTTPANIYATMMGDRLQRFVQYWSGFGLAGKSYPGATPRHK